MKDHALVFGLHSVPLDDRNVGEVAARDNDLLRRAVSDPTALAAFYESTVDELLRYFRRQVFDTDIGADLTAETYAQLLRHVRRFDPTRGSAQQFLYGIARHQYLGWCRKGEVARRFRRSVALRPLPAWPDTEQAVIDRVDAQRLRAALDMALDRLTERERDVVTMRVFDVLSHAEIAAKLGCSVTAARSTLSRGLAKLASLVDEGAAP